MRNTENAVVKTNPAEQFRAKAASLLSSNAEASLHELVDEFQRLTDVMDRETEKNKEGYEALNDIGQLASRERKIIVGVAKARFGISFEGHDRSNPEDGGW